MSAAHMRACASGAQVMEEVMAKSKAFKAAKSAQREEDLTATDALDADFQVAPSSLTQPHTSKPVHTRYQRMDAAAPSRGRRRMRRMLGAQAGVTPGPVPAFLFAGLMALG